MPRRGATSQHVFVNGRLVQDRVLTHAIAGGVRQHAGPRSVPGDAPVRRHRPVARRRQRAPPENRGALRPFLRGPRRGPRRGRLGALSRQRGAAASDLPPGGGPRAGRPTAVRGAACGPLPRRRFRSRPPSLLEDEERRRRSRPPCGPAGAVQGLVHRRAGSRRTVARRSARGPRARLVRALSSARRSAARCTCSVSSSRRRSS